MNKHKALEVARMYLTPEHNKELSDAFNAFTLTGSGDAEARVVAELQRLRAKYPQFVYMPFIDLYNHIPRSY